MAFKPVLAHASCIFDIAGFGEIGKFLLRQKYLRSIHTEFPHRLASNILFLFKQMTKGG